MQVHTQFRLHLLKLVDASFQFRLDRTHSHPTMTAVCVLQVKGIPFLAFDAGGVLEMFDPKEFSDNVVFEPTLAALKRKLSFVVSQCPGPAHHYFLRQRSTSVVSACLSPAQYCFLSWC